MFFMPALCCRVLVSSLAQAAECAREMRRINSLSDASSPSEASKKAKLVFETWLKVARRRFDTFRSSPLGKQLGARAYSTDRE